MHLFILRITDRESLESLTNLHRILYSIFKNLIFTQKLSTFRCKFGDAYRNGFMICTNSNIYSEYKNWEFRINSQQIFSIFHVLQIHICQTVDVNTSWNLFTVSQNKTISVMFAPNYWFYRSVTPLYFVFKRVNTY